MAAISMRGLTKRYGSVVAVDGLGLEVGDGEFVSLLGPSGCGKSTSLNLLAGFLEPDAGEIRVDGELLSSPAGVVPPERRNMSLIFQSYAVWPHKTVFENVAFGLKVRRAPNSELCRRVQEMLEKVHLEELAARYPGELSGGQQQRVALARALVIEPRILLLDEPLSNLDAHLREDMRFEIRRLHQQFKITTIYVTHDQAEALVMSDRVVILNAGRLEQVGTPAEVYERPRSRFVANFIGRTNCLAGTLAADGTVECAALKLAVPEAQARQFAQGSAVVLCIRPQHVALYPPGSVAHGSNHFCAVVERNTYLGEARDYLLSLGSNGATLRAVTSPEVDYPEGQSLVVVLNPDRCHLVRD